MADRKEDLLLATKDPAAMQGSTDSFDKFVATYSGEILSNRSSVNQTKIEDDITPRASMQDLFALSGRSNTLDKDTNIVQNSTLAEYIHLPQNTEATLLQSNGTEEDPVELKIKEDPVGPKVKEDVVEPNVDKNPLEPKVGDDSVESNVNEDVHESSTKKQDFVVSIAKVEELPVNSNAKEDLVESKVEEFPVESKVKDPLESNLEEENFVESNKRFSAQSQDVESRLIEQYEVYLNPKRISEQSQEGEMGVIKQYQASLNETATKEEEDNTQKPLSFVGSESSLPDLEIDSERQLRLIRVLSKRHDRTTVHVEQFIRVLVTINPFIKLTIIVDKNQTIEYLGHQIEAEYAFRHLIPREKGLAGTEDVEEEKYDILEVGLIYNGFGIPFKFSDFVGEVLSTDDEISVLNIFEPKIRSTSILFKSTSDLAPPNSTSPSRPLRSNKENDVIPSSSGIIITENKTFTDASASSPLPISVRNVATSTSSLQNRNTPDKIDAVMQTSETFTLPVQEEKQEEATINSTAVTSSSPPLVSEAILVDKLPTSDASIVAIHSDRMDSAPSTVSSDIAMTSQLTNDDQLQSLFHNSLGLEYFKEFCIQDYTIENLLFWLDVELFQGCPDIHQRLYAKYIYLTYLANNAPLLLNLSEEVRKEVPWPISKEHVEITMFDDVQEQVYSMLRGYSFQRFCASDFFKKYSDKKQFDRKGYKNAKIQGSLIAHFPKNWESMLESVKILEDHEETITAAMTISNVSNQNTSSITSNKLFKPIAAINEIFSEGSLNAIPPNSPNFSAQRNKKSTLNRVEILTKAIYQYFPESNNINLTNYFDTPSTKLSTQQKQTKIQKEKKLAKFFGVRPSGDIILKQHPLNKDPSNALINAYPGKSSISISSSLSDNDSGNITMHGHHSKFLPGTASSTSDFFAKKKKVEKLEEFFGDKLPTKQLRTQMLSTTEDVESNESISSQASPNVNANRLLRAISGGNLTTEVVEPPPTQNELDPEEKRILTKRHNKLKSMLGEPLASEQLAALSVPNIRLSPVQLRRPLQLGSSPEIQPIEGAGNRPIPFSEPTSPINLVSPTPEAIGPHEEGSNDSCDNENSKSSLNGSRSSTKRHIRRSSEGSLPLEESNYLHRTGIDSSHSTISSISNKDTKEYRRKKLRKLQQFLGERITLTTLTKEASNIAGNGTDSSAAESPLMKTKMDHSLHSTHATSPNLGNSIGAQQRIMSSKERQAQVKRINKLERVFGSVPPVALVNADDTPAELTKKTIASLSYILDQQREFDFVELIENMAEFDLELEGKPTSTGFKTTLGGLKSSGTTGMHSASFNNIMDAMNNETSSVAAKQARQRKLLKLQRFFGNNLNTETLIELNILRDLEKSIEEEVTNPEELKQLKIQIQTVRDSVRKQSIHMENYQYNGYPETQVSKSSKGTFSFGAKSSSNIPRPSSPTSNATNAVTSTTSTSSTSSTGSSSSVPTSPKVGGSKNPSSVNSSVKTGFLPKLGNRNSRLE